MEVKMIQAAIVGCGNIAHSHVEGLLSFLV